jgi:uncharacterized protein
MLAMAFGHDNGLLHDAFAAQRNQARRGREVTIVTNDIRDNTARNRFEMDVGNDVAIVNYRLSPGVLMLTHTEVPQELEGQGLGSTIVRGVLQIARARGLKVVPACGFVSAFIRKNPEFQDLLV